MTRQPAPGSRRSAGRSRPARARTGGGRLARTILLATVAAAFAIYWVSGEMGLDRDELLGYATTSLLVVGLVVVLGMALGALPWLIRRAGARRDRNPPE